MQSIRSSFLIKRFCSRGPPFLFPQVLEDLRDQPASEGVGGEDSPTQTGPASAIGWSQPPVTYRFGSIDVILYALGGKWDGGRHEKWEWLQGVIVSRPNVHVKKKIYIFFNILKLITFIRLSTPLLGVLYYTSC